MNKKLIEITMSIYLKFRKSYEEKIFNMFRDKKALDESSLNPTGWAIVSKYTIENFSKYINTFDYKADFLQGLVDMSFPKSSPNYFFSNISYGRDCDDWSRIWLLYLEEHGWEDVTEVCVTSNDHPFKNSHFITVAKKNGKYHCFNYLYSSIEHDTFEEAVQEVCEWKIYTKENLVWKRY